MKYKLDKVVTDTMRFTEDKPSYPASPTSQSNDNWVDWKQDSGQATKIDVQMDGPHVNSYHPEHDTPDRHVDYIGQPVMSDDELTVKVANGGYAVHRVRGLDAEQSNDHYVNFYDEVERKDKITGQKSVGMLERGNVLDRI